jgi:hypothetical protein
MKAARPGFLAGVLCITVWSIVFVACGPRAEQEQQQSAAEATPPTEQPAPASAQAAGPKCPPCEGDCGNYPYQPTDCWTTKHGPAKADVVESTTNLLYCKDTPFALCFFSGPPTSTGRNPRNPALPCVLRTEGEVVRGRVASCTCQAYRQASFVDINGILNLGAYQETVQACGPDGSGCANLQTCGKDGSKCAGSNPPQEAPVCKYVRQQNPNDPTVSLMPKADLISTFSLTAMEPNYQVGVSPLPKDGNCHGRYAGCMTAPCFFEEGTKQPFSDGDPVTCECPTFEGPYQVGQFKQQCDIPQSDGNIYVWSAANHVGGTSLE